MQAQNLKLKKPTVKIPAILPRTLERILKVIKYKVWEKYITRIIIGVLITDALLLGVVAIRIYSPISLAEQTAMYSLWGQSASAGSTPLVQILSKNSDTAGLYSYLQNQNLNPLIVSIVKRPEFSVEGRLIKLNSDSIFVFEYNNTQDAQHEASIAAATYSKKNTPGLWDSNVSIYTRNNLVIFYSGNNKTIKSSLSDFEGPSLINDQVTQSTTF